MAAAAAPPVENLGFLLAKASQRWNERLTTALAVAGYRQVRASYGSVLLPLWEQDGQRIGALANRARLSKQTMTTLVRLTERDGLVVCRTDPADRRATRVWLSPTAAELASVAAGVVEEMTQALESALGPSTMRSVRRALTTIMSMEGATDRP